MGLWVGDCPETSGSDCLLRGHDVAALLSSMSVHDKEEFVQLMVEDEDQDSAFLYRLVSA